MNRNISCRFSLAVLGFALFLSVVEPPLVFAAGVLVELDTSFDAGWRELFDAKNPADQLQLKVASLKKLGIRPNASGNDNALLIPPKAVARTLAMKYVPGGVAEIEIDASTVRKNGRVEFSMVFLDGLGKEIGRKNSDALEIEPSRQLQTYQQKIPIDNRAGKFRLEIKSTEDSSPIVVGALRVRLLMDGYDMLIGDPGFEGTLRMDHWFSLTGQKDWDGILLAGKNSRFRKDSSTKVAGKFSLELKGPGAALRSRRFQCRGRTLLLSAWVKTKDIGRIPNSKAPGWASSAIQISGYDKDGKPVGHSDLLLRQKGTFGWQHRLMKVQFVANVHFVEVIVRHFPGIKGYSWFDHVCLLQKKADAQALPYNPHKGTICVDLSKISPGPIKNIWNAHDIVYACDALDKNCQAQMRLAKSEINFEMLRIRELLNIYKVRLSEDGKLSYDWTNLDLIFDFLIKDLKIIPLITIESTPHVISSIPGKAFVNRHRPSDYKQWQKVVEDMVGHLIDRYGKDCVKSWYWDIWNEPGAYGSFFWGSTEEYQQILVHAHYAMRNIEKRYGMDLKVGTSSGGDYWTDLETLKNAGLVENVDFISFHHYSGLKSSLSLQDTSMDSVKQAKRTYSLPDAEIFNSEWNGDTMPNSIKDTEVLPSLAVKSIRKYLDSGIDKVVHFALPCRGFEWSRYQSKGRPFIGGLAIIDRNMMRLPAYNAYVLLNKLDGGRRISLSSSNEPFDGIAVRFPDGRVNVIITNFDEDFKSAKDRNSKLTIVFRQADKPLKCKQAYLIDSTHSIAIDDFRAMGSPLTKNLSAEAVGKLVQASKLEQVTPATVLREGKKQYVELNFKGQSVWFGEFQMEPAEKR